MYENNRIEQNERVFVYFVVKQARVSIRFFYLRQVEGITLYFLGKTLLNLENQVFSLGMMISGFFYPLWYASKSRKRFFSTTVNCPCTGMCAVAVSDDVVCAWGYPFFKFVLWFNAKSEDCHTVISLEKARRTNYNDMYVNCW